MKHFILLIVAAIALVAAPASAAKKKPAPSPAPSARQATPTQSATPAAASGPTIYYCTLWHEVHYDSAATPRLEPVGYVPIPHMGNISITKETGTKVPRPVDQWDDDHDVDHDHNLVKAPKDSAAIDTVGGYVLSWDKPFGGRVRYDFLTIREDHKGPVKPFFAGMGGNLYLGTCEL